jgi:beta-mannosidase
MKYFLFLLATLLLFVSCQGPSLIQEQSVLKLNDNWSFKQADRNEWQAATVPGCVHTDLLALGLIEDPFYGDNEKDLQWIEKKDWEYQREFSLDKLEPGRQYELLFEGLDTYADVYLNEQKVGSAENMFIAHRFNVSEFLQQGTNTLRVYFHSPVRIGLEKASQFDYLLPASNEQAPEGEKSNVFSRKAPFHFGWDWGPRYVTSGIWRPVELLSYEKADLRDVYFQPVNVKAEKASYQALVEVEATTEAKAHLRLSIDGVSGSFGQEYSLSPGLNVLPLPFHLDQPQLWWANGLGEPHLYTVNLEVQIDGQSQIQHSQRLGVRSIEFVNEPDSIGESFYFKLNGRPVFMKGANYIPSDIFLTRQTPGIYNRTLDDAVAANMNMLRVWGGAIYENDLFYELCDEKGIMIWQDFMFACSMFPNTPEHLANIEKEAVYNVRRLRKNPSVVFWCGNNENYIAWHNWGWRESYEEEVRDHIWEGYQQVFHQMLPEVVEKYAPELRYWPSSPQSHYEGSQPSTTHGDQHEWGVWFNQQDFDFFWEQAPRFASEYGVQSYPEMKTMYSFAPETELRYGAPLLDDRQRCKLDWMEPGKNGNHLILDYIERYYPSPQTFEDYVYLSQLMHAKALEVAIDAHRASQPRTMGSLYWQLNDCWPALSWATVDYFGRWKPAHYAVKRAFEKLRLIGKTNGKTFLVYGVSEEDKPIKAELELKFLSFNGQELSAQVEAVTLAPNTSTVLQRIELPEEIVAAFDNTVLLMTLRTESEVLTRNVHFFKDEKDLALTKPKIKVEVKQVSGGAELTLTSDVLARNVVITSPQVEGFLGDNNFDLIPGEKKVLRFRTGEELGNTTFEVYSLWDSFP